MQSWALLVPQPWHKALKVSSVVMEDVRRNLKSLGDIKDLLDCFNPKLTAKFSIKSLLTLVVVVPLTCPYSLNSITDSAGNQGTVEEAMFYTICLLHSFQVLLPTGFHHHILQWFTQVMPSKSTQTIWKAGEWNEEIESNVWSECPPENSTKYDATKDNFVCSLLSDCTAPRFHSAE